MNYKKVPPLGYGEVSRLCRGGGVEPGNFNVG